ncbi:uncharacterized protein LOC106156633 [Lingula anatina]|uniref:Uncharacterized protein LOC106156633 n=1 Tax=Lingula anatina TaxID=7574 RepID=A0A1S3HMZ2_LINAN|nr:uncharacterized protein LOC106156633 [Lingula anatina]|eukprot:XP_013387425.1 uncharacterized protein LOC106156633 [Lingula anatina]
MRSSTVFYWMTIWAICIGGKQGVLAKKTVQSTIRACKRNGTFCDPRDSGKYYVCLEGHTRATVLTCPPGLYCKKGTFTGTIICDHGAVHYEPVRKKSVVGRNVKRPVAEALAPARTSIIDDVLKALHSLAKSSYSYVATMVHNHMSHPKTSKPDSNYGPKPSKKYKVDVISYPDVKSKCNADKCKLPSCLCPSTAVPNKLQAKELPQIVYFTFDDGVNTINHAFYERLFPENRRNPNGCPIKATFFVSHDTTDYDLVNSMYLRGHEIASHSVTHRTPTTWWKDASYEDLKEEISGQRDNIHTEAHIPISAVRGVRVPFLQQAGDIFFRMMKDQNFLFDSSLVPSRPHSPNDHYLPTWPFTMDSPISSTLFTCTEGMNCPTGNFSGVWELPMNRMFGPHGFPCAMVDGCPSPNNVEESYDYLMSNFKRHYNGNRAPMGLNMHAAWFVNRPHNLDAMDKFIGDLVKKDDVWILTASELIKWVKNITPQSQMRSFNFNC